MTSWPQRIISHHIFSCFIAWCLKYSVREMPTGQEFLHLLRMNLGSCVAPTIKYPWATFWHVGMSDKSPSNKYIYKTNILCIYCDVRSRWKTILFTYEIPNLNVGWLLGCFILRRINPFRDIWYRIKFQTIQFSVSIVFLFTQLNVKTVLFQTIRVSISTPFSSIWPIDRTLSGATEADLEVMATKGYSAFPKAPTLPEPQCHIQDTHRVGGGLTPLQRCCRCFLKPWPTGQPNVNEREKVKTMNIY